MKNLHEDAMLMQHNIDQIIATIKSILSTPTTACTKKAIVRRNELEAMLRELTTMKETIYHGTSNLALDTETVLATSLDLARDVIETVNEILST